MPPSHAEVVNTGSISNDYYILAAEGPSPRNTNHKPAASML